MPRGVYLVFHWGDIVKVLSRVGGSEKVGDSHIGGRGVVYRRAFNPSAQYESHPKIINI